MRRISSRGRPVVNTLYVAVAMLALIGGPAQSADLLEIYHLAQQSDPTFEAARYAYDAALQKIPEARAGLLPVVSANANGNQTRATTEFTGSGPDTRPVRSWAWTVQLTQPLLRFGNLYALSEAQGIVEQAKAQYVLAEQNLIVRVAQAYFDVEVAEEGIAVADAQLRAMEEQLAQAQHGFKAGTSTITDVHEAQSHSDSARAQKVAASNDLEAKRAELEKIVGQLSQPLAALKPETHFSSPQPANPQEWIDQARYNNPGVHSQEAVLATAEATIKKNRSDHLPTLDLVGSYGTNSASGSVSNPVDFANRTRSKQVGLQLTIPIFSGGATNARVTEAIANKFKARADLEAARRQAATDARVAYAGVMNGLSQIEALDSAVVSGKSAVKGNRIGYRVGIRINLDVLNTEQQLYTAQRDLTKARYDTLLQGLKLKAAGGSLSEADLQDLNRLFEMQ
jgi:outer membrane protein